MKGDELEMLSRHDKQINDEIIPKLVEHDQRFLAHEQRMTALEREQKEYRLEMGKVTNSVEAIKNNQDNFKETLNIHSARQENRLDKILELTFDIKGKQTENEGEIAQAKVSSDEKVSIARFTTKEKIIGTTFGAIFGVGGLSGLIVALPEAIAALKTFLGGN